LSASPDVTEEMLSNMFIGKPAGNYDPILDFSTAVNGCLFFVPTADFLDDPGGAVASPATAIARPEGPAPEDGSRQIGRLK
jgi:putative iron-dependent peroxidase